MGEPSRDQFPCLSTAIANLALQRRALRERFFISSPIFWFWNEQKRRPVLSLVVEGMLREIVEECCEPVKIPLRNRIELVIVAVGAPGCQTQEAALYASVRSRLLFTRSSSLSVPPSAVLIPARTYAEATMESRVLAGSISPASCSLMN